MSTEREMLGDISPGWIAVISTIAGTLGLPLLRNLLGRAKAKQDEQAALREELRQDIVRYKDDVEDLRVQLRDATRELDEWKVKYYELYVQSLQLRIAAQKLDITKP